MKHLVGGGGHVLCTIMTYCVRTSKCNSVLTACAGEIGVAFYIELFGHSKVPLVFYA